MSILIRAIAYASLFIGILLIYVPARLLSWTGIARAPAVGAPQVTGMIISTLGAFLALWCIFTFVWVGKGTPAPFDPPRKLVIHGPYRFVRNPMYLGAELVLAGAGLFYESLFLLGYAGVFLLVSHLFVISFEEPTLRTTFGTEYEIYCRKVKRWWPIIRSSGDENP